VGFYRRRSRASPLRSTPAGHLLLQGSADVTRDVVIVVASERQIVVVFLIRPPARPIIARTGLAFRLTVFCLSTHAVGACKLRAVSALTSGEGAHRR
jgi:hypothetical protein